MAPGYFLRLNNGRMIPQLAFGTFGAGKEVAAAAIKEAFDVGYRHVDCGPSYGNEKEVGQGIAESMKKHGLKREDIFITSKLWCDKHDPKDVRRGCEESLKNLGLDYLDLYLIHYPFSFHVKEGVKYDANDPNCFVFEEHKLEDTWSAMEELVHAGLLKSIGVSNFNKRQVEKILKHAKIVPAVNQVEVNLHCPNTKLIEFCKSKNITIEGYSVLGSFNSFLKKNVILPLEAVVEIAKKRIKTPAQVLLRHGLQRNIVVIVGGVIPEQMREDYDVFDFELSEEEMNQLNNAGRNERLIPVLTFAGHPEYPFHDEF
ncbi:hypothetical protein Aperf_G00000117166 [Anoplocephala perfoliata]